jgi:acyl-CoA reductase-like NAD-dependent aldehyde dehydrogenase
MSQAASPTDVQTLDNFIGGRWVKAQATEFFDVHNPAVGDVIGRTPLSTSGDVDAAVQAATKAFSGWRDTPADAAGG